MYLSHIRSNVTSCARYRKLLSLTFCSTSNNNKPKSTTTKISQEDLKRIWTVPNAITVCRIVASPLLGVAIAQDMKEVALCGCFVAAFSDWLDGYIAKNYDQKSHLGSLLDPLADKLVIGALTTGLAYKAMIPLELCALIIGRDSVLIIGALYMRYKTLPIGVGYWEYSHASMFTIAPSLLSKVLYYFMLLLL
jgi:cardiolipin synthase